MKGKLDDMKKLICLGAFCLMLLGTPAMVDAEVRFKLECDEIAMSRGESTTCTFSGIGDPLETEGITSITLDVEVGEGLTIEGVQGADSAWVVSNAGTGDKKRTVVLSSSATEGVVGDTFDILTVTVKMDSDATECGSICVEASSYVQGGKTLSGSAESRTCKEIEIAGVENPETGAFASVGIIMAGVTVSSFTIVSLRNKNKFYKL